MSTSRAVQLNADPNSLTAPTIEVDKHVVTLPNINNLSGSGHQVQQDIRYVVHNHNPTIQHVFMNPVICVPAGSTPIPPKLLEQLLQNIDLNNAIEQFTQSQNTSSASQSPQNDPSPHDSGRRVSYSPEQRKAIMENYYGAQPRPAEKEPEDPVVNSLLLKMAKIMTSMQEGNQLNQQMNMAQLEQLALLNARVTKMEQEISEGRNETRAELADIKRAISEQAHDYIPKVVDKKVSAGAK